MQIMSENVLSEAISTEDHQSVMECLEVKVQELEERLSGKEVSQ